MGYVQDFYPFNIGDSYMEYVISELKYDDGDILLSVVDKIAKTAQRFPFDRTQYDGNYRNGTVMKVLQN